MTDGQDASIIHAVSGGLELVHWFGQVPTFHDAEVISLDLCRIGQSTLRVHGWAWNGKMGDDGFAMHKHAIVTFTLEGIMDLQLDGFSVQNVLFGLVLRHARTRPERQGYLSLSPLPEDIEIELKPCYGLSGLIRARSVVITFKPGKPSEKDA